MSDGERMFNAVDKNRKLFENFLPWVKPTKTQTDSEEYIKSTIKHWDESTGFDFSIIQKDAGVYIGNLGLHSLSLQNLRAEFGYWLDVDAQGRGFMREAVSAYEEVCFDAGLNRLEIRCAPENLKSAAVPQKLGYRLEGRLKENCFINGKAQDTLIFAKIRSDQA